MTDKAQVPKGRLSSCRICGSYAVNHGLYGRDGTDGDLCDAHYWKTRAEDLKAEVTRREALDHESKRALDKHNQQLAAENAALREANASLRDQIKEWQPIETAPKLAGERVIVLKDCGPGTLSSMSIAFWLYDGQWYLSDSTRTAESYGYRVTHWLPLPAAFFAQGEQP